MSKSTLDSISPDLHARLKNFMTSAMTMKQEMSDLNGALKDAAKALAEELNVKPAVIMKAVRVAFKNNMLDEKESVDTVEDILNITGHC